MWKLVVVEDEPLILSLLERLLSKHPSIEIVATFTSSKEALEQIPRLQCDALLLDIEMPGMTGLELAQKLVIEGIDVPVIFSTAYPQYALEAFSVQALDYVLKPMTPSIVQKIDDRLKRYYGVKRRESIEHSTQLKVQMFGNPIVHVNNDVVVKWPTKVTEELFYYFLLNKDEVCNKWKIIDAIWPNLEEKRAVANLYNTIYRLRQVFSAMNVPLTIERVNEGYKFFGIDVLEVDWYIWRDWMKKFTISPQEMEQHEAVYIYSLYKGDLLETKGYLWSMPVQYQTQDEWHKLKLWLKENE
ncbi:response regulator [Peribacillus asahii]|uniref:response regulator n=1 Tax=Peribacillus asahii TaxID=228899 RepID=UPI003813C070